MATKNLSRSIIEGGRTKGNKWDRRNSHRFERASQREFLKRVSRDVEAADEYFIEEKDHVRKEFDDKLGPVYRWLERQVGRPWDEVRSEVSQTFDTRTTAGRHIVHDHMLSQVQTGPEPQYRWSSLPDDPTVSYFKHDYYVDDNGILQQKTYIKRFYGNSIPKFDTVGIVNWLDGRIVGKVGDHFFWFVPVGKNKKHRGGSDNRQYKWEWGNRDKSRYYDFGSDLRLLYLTDEVIYKRDSSGNYILNEKGSAIQIGIQKVWRPTSLPFLRQNRKLNDKELAYWNTIPEWYQTKILEKSPTYPNPPQSGTYLY